MPLVAAVALCDSLDRPTRVLAGCRDAPAALAGRWEFPGGKVEPGEDPVPAACVQLDAVVDVDVRVLTQRLGRLDHR